MDQQNKQDYGQEKDDDILHYKGCISLIIDLLALSNNTTEDDLSKTQPIVYADTLVCLLNVQCPIKRTPLQKLGIKLFCFWTDFKVSHHFGICRSNIGKRILISDGLCYMIF